MSSVKDWAAPNPITENRGGLIGKGVDRYEGRLKVTGSAPYAYEVDAPSRPAIGYMATASIAKGIRTLEVSAFTTTSIRSPIARRSKANCFAATTTSR